jgi:alpha-galactosidase
VLHAGTPGFNFGSGQVYAVHTAYSGNHTHYAERVFTGQRVLGGGELLLTHEVSLVQGDSYASPWIYGSFGVGLDEVAQRFHRFLRSRSPALSVERPVTLNVWEAVYFAHDLAHLSDLADRAAEIGVERFVLDDGWFGARRGERAGLGDWVVSPEVWPQGLHPLVDHVRRLGMEFGLWFEPEMVNPDSDVARAHPEWIMAAREQWPVESRYQQVLNLGIPEAYSYIKTQILAVLTEYDIGYIKWDHNRDLIEAGTRSAGGIPGVHAQTRALYRLLDEIRAAFPTLEIESCSSGGARVDLGILQRTDRVWVSDNIDPLERQHMLRWTTQLIPPEFMGSHIASGRSHTTGRVHDLGFRAATAVFGHLGIEWDLARATEVEIRELTEWVAFFKSQRELLLTGDVVRQDTHDDNMFVHGVVSADKSQAIFAIAAVGSLDASPGPSIRFRGLDRSRSYRVRPLLVGSPPSGLRAPYWWGRPSKGSAHDAPPADQHRHFDATIDYHGAVFSGATLEHVGLAAPRLNPDQVVLLHAQLVPPREPR